MQLLSSEQLWSAYRALTGARIRRGDTTEIEIALGLIPSGNVESKANLAFCSAWIRRGNILQRGASCERSQAIEGDIVFRNPEEMIQQLKDKTGIAYLRGRVRISRRVEFMIDPSSIQVIPVCEQDVDQLRWPHGISASRRILQKIHSPVSVLS